MTLPAVLVIGSPRNAVLRDALLESGVTPVFRETILKAIDSLHRDQFVAIVVDESTARVDVLELVLNIRDLDDRLPTFLVATAPSSAPPAGTPPDVRVVCREDLPHKLAKLRSPQQNTESAA